MDEQQLKFIIDTTETLSRIEANQIRTTKDVNELCIACAKIPAIETGLNNHLATHDNRLRYIFYPVSAAIVLAGLAAFTKLILHVF